MKTKQKTWEAMSLEEKKVLIAEKIFGWKKETRKKYAGAYDVNGWGLNSHLGEGHRDRQFHMNECSFPDWPTSLPAAFAVVEKMKDHYIDIERCPWESEKAVDKKAVGAWIVFVITPGAPYKNVEAIAETLPEAICLAALRAKGIEV